MTRGGHLRVVSRFGRLTVAMERTQAAMQELNRTLDELDDAKAFDAFVADGGDPAQILAVERALGVTFA